MHLLRSSTLAIASAAAVLSCAPLPDRGENYPLRYDLDYDVVIRLDQAAVTIPDIPELDGGEDCNDNRIEDTFDYAGYVPRGPYPVGDGPRYVAAGTVSGGTRQDLLVVNHDAGTLSVLNQRYDRRFVAGGDHAIGNEASAIAVADIDGDARTDVLIGHDGGVESVTVLRGLPGGGFAREEHPVSTDPFLERAPRGVVVANLDGGALDVIASSGASPGNKLFTLFSGAAFDAPQHTQVPLQNPGTLIAGDFDGDGDVEVCGTTTVGAKVSCVENALDRPIPQPFSNWEHWTFDTGVEPRSIAAGDLDGDGLLDLVIAGGEAVAVLRNTGGIWGHCGTYSDDGRTCLTWVGDRFAAPELIELGGATQAVVVADLDEDGDKDIAVTLPDDDTVVFLANSRGSFIDGRGRPRAVRLPVRSRPYGILAQDIDGDGHMEVVVANQGSDDLWVLHRRATPINMMLECLPMLERREPPTP